MYRDETLLTQLGNRVDHETGAISLPIHLSTAYRHPTLAESTGYDYTRTKNPTRYVLEQGIAELEGGTHGFACSSGMAAIQLVLSLFQAGDHLLVPTDIYGGTYRLFDHLSQQYQIEISYLNFKDTVALKQAIRSTTKAIFLETPTNPLLEELDIAEVSSMARSFDLKVIVDNTFYTPYLQKPLTLGADIVIHSATKYLAGHNDVLAGLVVSKDSEISDRLEVLHNNIGATLSPFDAWLVIRGMKTLPLRLKQQQENAKHIVAYLQSHDKITTVIYPGKGGMLSFHLKKQAWVKPFLEQLRIISFAESLGGVESLITYPTTQTHADIPEQERIARGIDQTLLRFSIGIEAIEDIILDLETSLSKLK
ncbi:methionine biosynthesis PLP-dependent protein [Amphibacillus cookii]|uniref:methionine biosynthesis PLP-dependent protein n=1 Tax=Amphibacillus cookii TaxID=767787 RepID=UPI00195C1B56|nr:methionine biosynthesis PLP-dependent protein [Amphibacillus cookii]MBM7539952.1 cystathionine gamma-synthase [Amphibacillus cookii]